MTTAYSTNLGLALPVQGELSGTWGDTVNNGITQYMDISVAGTLSLSGDGAVTLSATNGNASGTNIGTTTAQYAILRVTGTLTTTKVITAPAASKTYVVTNGSTGGFGVTLRGAGPTTGVTIAAGETAFCAWNGSDFVKVSSSLSGTGDVTGPSSSVDSEIALFSSTTGKVIKRATTTGVLKASSGVIAAAVAGTDIVVPGGALGTPSSGTLTSCTGLPISTGVSGLGTGVATFLATPSSANLRTAVTDETGTGVLVFGTNPTITGTREVNTAVAASAIDLTLGNYFTKTISTTTTFTVSNVPASNTVQGFILQLTNGGSATVNWFSGVKWTGGVAPTLTTSGVDLLGFYTIDGGTTWRGLVLSLDNK